MSKTRISNSHESINGKGVRLSDRFQGYSEKALVGRVEYLPAAEGASDLKRSDLQIESGRLHIHEHSGHRVPAAEMSAW